MRMCSILYCVYFTPCPSDWRPSNLYYFTLLHNMTYFQFIYCHAISYPCTHYTYCAAVRGIKLFFYTAVNIERWPIVICWCIDKIELPSHLRDVRERDFNCAIKGCVNPYHYMTICAFFPNIRLKNKITDDGYKNKPNKSHRITYRSVFF